jgi:hypothetical protein
MCGGWKAGLRDGFITSNARVAKSLTSAFSYVLVLFMASPSDTAERHARILGRFAELAESLAEHLHDEVLAAGTAQDKRDLTLAFHRITRSGRQTLALEARLERDRKLEAVADLASAECIARAPIERRKAQIAAAVERLIWTEAEGKEAERLELALGDLMDEDDLHGRYAEGPVADHIKRLCVAIGLARPEDEILIFPTGAVSAPDAAPRPPNSS